MLGKLIPQVLLGRGVLAVISSHPVGGASKSREVGMRPRHGISACGVFADVVTDVVDPYAETGCLDIRHAP